MGGRSVSQATRPRPGRRGASEHADLARGTIHRDTGLVDQFVDLGTPGHQRRGHDHAAEGGADDHALLEADGAAAPGQIVLVGEALAGRLVLGELQRGDEAGALDLADQRMVAEDLAQAALQVGAGLLLTRVTTPSSRSALRLAMATAAATGWPE